MPFNRNRWITRVVVAGVVATGAWSLASVVEPDGGSRPEVTAPAVAVRCTGESHLTLTYRCTGG